MVRPASSPGHRYTVELRFVGADLDPCAVTSALGIAPSIWNRPDAPLPGRTRPPLWGYNGHDDPAFRAEWSSLEDALTFLLGKLAPVRPDIVALAARYDGCWWCGHFHTGFDGGPTLSPGLMAELATFGCPLFLDTYHAEDEAPSPYAE